MLKKKKGEKKTKTGLQQSSFCMEESLVESASNQQWVN